MTLPEKFSQFVKAGNLFHPKDRLLIAVSGGVDSVVLCDLCKKAGYDFVIAHCNFQLRGAESDADELFVKELADKYCVDIYTRKFDTEKYAAEYKLSIQVAARNLRYEWFNKLIAEHTDTSLNYLLTAHHANDNIETVLMNFFKGTGIAGLQGIQPKSGNANQLIRPLLFAKKEELLQYAEENNLSFREDSSNSSDKYTRNNLRNKLLPSLQELYPNVEDNLLGNIERFHDFYCLYHIAVKNIQKKLLFVKGDEIHIPVLKLLKTPALKTIVYEIIHQYGFIASQADDVIRLLHSGSGKYVTSHTHRILHNRNWLIISKLHDISTAYIVIEEKDTRVAFADKKLTLEFTDLPGKIDAGNSIALLDAGVISFPFLLRKWKKGDYFYPLGMQKKKKLSNFFIDRKLSVPEKEKTWVVEMDKKIIWVIGQRIDDRFKITGNTVKVLKLTVSTP